MSDNEIEQQIQAKGLTAPRVTLAHVEGCIAYEYYITGDQIPAITTPALGIGGMAGSIADPLTSLSCLTFCVLVLKNGFTVTGESACASPENFDAALGRKIARQKAVEKIWLLEGYLLKERIYNDAQIKGTGT
jgi:hypothetical protein